MCGNLMTDSSTVTLQDQDFFLQLMLKSVLELVITSQQNLLPCFLRLALT